MTIPVASPEETATIDAMAPDPVEVLIERAGAAVARAALRLLGGAYGRRVVVIAGPGSNGADGRVAAARLRRRGVRTVVVPAGSTERLPVADLVIDAAYGTGFRGSWSPPPGAGDRPVLAVDLPSGLDARTGDARGTVLGARVTVTFAALKPGLLLGRGPELAGEVEVADIGLDVGQVGAGLVEDADVARWLPPRPRDSHKWRSALWVVAGSATMPGAAALATRAALRAGAGYVRVSVPGQTGAGPVGIPEAVSHPLGGEEWADEVLAGIDRFGALVIGPGLGRDERTMAEVRRLVARCPVAHVIDADGLWALGHEPGTWTSARSVLTPHDGELRRLQGGDAAEGGEQDDRLAAAAGLASVSGGVALLKGSTTVVARAGRPTLLAAAGDARLATAGTGDVLAGVIGAFLAQGIEPQRAAAAAAHVHGRAAALGWRRGLVAGDLPELLPAAIDRMAPVPSAPGG